MDISAEELTRNCKAAYLPLGDSLPTKATPAACLPAAVLPRHSALTLTQTPGSHRDWRGLRGREATAAEAGDGASWGCRRWAGPACYS